MFEIVSSLLKYIFITVIYLFIFGIIRLIYLDIESMNRRKDNEGNHPYLKLINRRDSLNFKVDESYVLDKDTVIGRSRKSDITVFDPFLSAQHARFILQDGKCLLEDIRSTNGTFLNGRPVTSKATLLANGDQLRLGQLEFLFVNNQQTGIHPSY